MKLFSLILSVTVFFISLYFFIADVSNIKNVNDVIYIALLCILMAICIIGVIINWGIVSPRRRNNTVLFINNGFSKTDKKIRQ